MNVPLVDLGSRNESLDRPLSEILRPVLEHGRFVAGPEVAAFEEAFARFCGTRHAIGVANGTDAITLSLLAADVGDGDEVIVPAMTFAATAEAVVRAQAVPVLVDVDTDGVLLDPELLERAITPRTRAIVPVHLYGRLAPLDEIRDVAAAKNLVVIEDAAQAHGAMTRGRRSGSVGLTGCFSFYPSKNLGGIGDGGMVITDDDEVAHKIRLLRNHGGERKYEHAIAGFNSRLDTLQAAALLAFLPNLDEWNRARQEHAGHYERALGDAVEELVLPANPDGSNVFHLYPVRVRNADDRDSLRKHLADLGIETGVHYPEPIHLMPAFTRLGYPRGSFPEAEHVAESTLSLPMYPGLTSSQVDFVATSVLEFLKGN